MDSLLNGVLSKIGTHGLDKIAASAGLNSAAAKTILEQAGPVLTSKMADNVGSKRGLDSLNAALAKHDGSVFDRLDDLVNPDVDTKGAKILDHILGNKDTGKLAEVLAKKNNQQPDAMKKMLEMAAPLVLGQLGSEKKNSNMDASGLFDMLQKEKSQTSSNSMLSGLAKQFLDKDKDGSILDDVMKMAGSFFKK